MKLLNNIHVCCLVTKGYNKYDLKFNFIKNMPLVKISLYEGRKIFKYFYSAILTSVVKEKAGNRILDKVNPIIYIAFFFL